MTSRFLRFAILFVLRLLTVQVAQPYIFPLLYSATTPKLVVPLSANRIRNEANSTATSALLIRVACQRIRDFASLESYIALPTPFCAGV